MAFVADNQDNETPDQEQQQAAAREALAAPMTDGAGSSVFGSTPGVGGSPSGNPAPRSDSSNSGFVGLQSYLAANQGQGQEMANNIASNVSGQAQDAQNQVNNLSQGFKGLVDQNTTTWNPDAVNTAINDAENLSANGTLSQQDLSNFGKMAGASYNGPTDLSQQGGYSQAAQAVTGAQNALGETQSESGREQLLGQVYGGNGQAYSNGERALDQGLVEGDAGAQKTLSGLNNQWSGIGQWLGNASNTAANEAANARVTDQTTAQNTADALGHYASYAPGTGANAPGTVSGGSGALGNWSSGVYDNVNTNLDNYNSAQAALKASEAPGGTWTPQELQNLGLNSGMHTYGVNLGSNYIQPGTADTVANTASTDQYAQQAALAQLAGALPGGAGGVGTQVLNAADASQAGTGAGVNGNGMYSLAKGADGKSVFQNDVDSAQAGMQNKISQVIQGYNPGISLQGWNPTTGTVNLAVESTNDLGNGTYASGTNPVTLRLSPTANGAQYTNQGENLSGLQSDAAWQQLLGTLNSTVGSPTGSAPSGFTSGGGSGSSTGVLPVQGAGTLPHLTPTVYAQGGMVPSLNAADRVLNEKAMAPIKEPKVPKLQRADVKLPTMPKLAEGGDVLDANARAHIAPKNFAEPGKHKYPIHDIEHARNALSRVAQFGSPKEQEVVRRQVHARYPSLAAEAAGGQVPEEPWANIKGLLKAAGGKVPGTPPVKHNSYSNDGVAARLSPGECVLPLSVMNSADPVKAAGDFVASLLAKKAGK